MTKVDFYILPTTDLDSRLRMVCRTTEKAYRLGHRIHIHTGSQALSQKIDELLWMFRDRSFVPHEIQPDDAEQLPVTVGHDWDPKTSDVLVNLAPEPPRFFSRFERVIEIVDQSPVVQHEGRNRYRFYRDRGYALKHHKVTA